MPQLRKCCVPTCNSDSESHRLFSFPRNDRLRQLWLSFLIPVNVELSGLSKEQLISRRVCQKHFDRHQFDSVGNRLAYGYPCLFSENEMLHGIPLGDHNMTDHNYALQPDIQEDITNSTIGTLVTSGNHLHFHNYNRNYDENYSQASTSALDGTERVTTLQAHTVGLTEIVAEPNLVSQAISTDLLHVIEKRQAMKPQHKRCIKSSVKKLATRCKCFLDTLNKRAVRESKEDKPFLERLDDAKNLSFKKSFVNNITNLTEEAQNIIEMQLRIANKKKKAMRYTVKEKLLSLSLMKTSPKGYRLLQKIFNLPTKRTLNRLAEQIEFDVGLNENVFSLLKHKAEKWDIKKKLCSILFDEVALTPHLTYVESQDIIRGFKDFGDKREFKFCDHALVFMLKGVCSNWRQPICYYFCEGTTAAATVVKILKQVVSKVSETELIPLNVVCDQGSTFRTAMKMLKNETERKRILTGAVNDGSIEISGKNLNVIYDPPHLLKSVRNNLLSKDMLFKGQRATWNDLKTVYSSDCQLGHTRMNKKLTDQHIYADKVKKMKVSIAAQTLSQTTSAMLKYTALFKTTVTGENVSETMPTTGEAVGFFDSLFDSVNGSQRSNMRGKLRGPIKRNSKQYSFWQEAKQILKNIKFLESNSKRALKNNKVYEVRVPCLDGWITTIESFERLSKVLFDQYEIQYYYPRNINQDPLENFFGRIRAINYRNINPDANTFVNAFKSLLMTNVMGPHSIYANCEDDGGETVISFLKLCKKDEEKENIVPITMVQEIGDNRVDQSISAANERLRVHSSAYTAGYICRKLTKRLNCKDCSGTFLEKDNNVFHTWIQQKEYKLLKNNNLKYPSKKFLFLYRNISGFIHDFLNKNAHIKHLKTNVMQNIVKNEDFNFLGCTHHKKNIIKYVVDLLLRLHIHNWCNIMNKIVNGNLHVKCPSRLSTPQQMALNKFKSRLKRK